MIKDLKLCQKIGLLQNKPLRRLSKGRTKQHRGGRFSEAAGLSANEGRSPEIPGCLPTRRRLHHSFLEWSVFPGKTKKIPVFLLQANLNPDKITPVKKHPTLQPEIKNVRQSLQSSADSFRSFQ